jgi:hypothetical protein
MRMERFFTPPRRLQDSMISNEGEPRGYTEVHLAVPIQVFLNDRWGWSDLQAFASSNESGMGKIIWITATLFVWVEEENTGTKFDHLEPWALQRATFTSTSGETHHLILAKVRITVTLTAEVSSTFWHAVTTSKCAKLKLENKLSASLLCSGPTLLQISETTLLRELVFKNFAFQEADYHALASLKKTGLDISFEGCAFDAEDDEGICTEWLRNSQLVTKLDSCKMENSILYSALNGNSSVKSLSMDATRGEFVMSDLAQVLPRNLGIETLRVILNPRDNTWSHILRSLWAHPRIQSVSLCFEPGLSILNQMGMMIAVLELAERNKGVYTIDLPDHAKDEEIYKDEEFYQNSILPRLEMNRTFEDQRQALIRADPAIRGKLLGRALHVVRNIPDVMFRFLSENVPEIVRSDEDGPIITTGQKRKKRKAQP